MTKTRKNYAMRISAILLMLTMTSLCMVSGTFAKYTAKKSNFDSARVASFKLDFNGADLPTQDIAVDLFSTTSLGDKLKSSNSDKVVAPSASGFFKIATTNEGEVAVKTTFTFAETNDNNIPIQYAVTTSEDLDGNETWKPAADGVSIPGASLAANGGSTTQYVHWKWVTPADVDGGPTGDKTDTDFGTAGTLATVKTTITCNVEQDTGA